MKKFIGWTLLGSFFIGISILQAIARDVPWWYGLIAIAFMGIIGLFILFCVDLINSDE